MCVKRGLVATAGTYQIVLQGEVRREFAGRQHRIVGYYLVRGAVIAHAYDGTVLHGTAGQVTHALAGAFGIEVCALQIGQYLADGAGGRYRRQRLYLVIDQIGHVDGDVAAVSLGPAFLPQVPGHLGHLVYHCRKSGAAFQYTFHFHSFVRGVPKLCPTCLYGLCHTVRQVPEACPGHLSLFRSPQRTSSHWSMRQPSPLRHPIAIHYI